MHAGQRDSSELVYHACTRDKNEALVDNKLIERKRQDTLEMCRMFNEENKLESLKSYDVRNQNFAHNHRRIKRDLKPENSSFNFEEARRVENIVDKLYDDMAENGIRVTYRQRDLRTTTTTVNFQNESARRFKFAPAELAPPLSNTRRPFHALDVDVGGLKIPWLKNWTHGIVPFFIDSNTYDSHLSEIIIKAFDYFEKATCIRLQRLRERPTDKNSLQNVQWLYITNPSGIRQCVHSNERKENKGVQMVVFGYDCLSLGEILHEIMHILGFSHEHTRPDRDQYITILWDNIKPGYKKYFEVRSNDPLLSLPYDYSSVLHYPSRAFSKNGQVTILTPGVKVGQREALSDVDITKVTTIFGPECINRNKEYLLKTCPSVVRMKKEVKNITQKEIEDYFTDRLWPYGIVNYRIRDKMEFSIEERENINAVMRHIEKETCIEFRDINMYEIEEDNYIDKEENMEQTDQNENKGGKGSDDHTLISLEDRHDETVQETNKIIKPTSSESETAYNISSSENAIFLRNKVDTKSNSHGGSKKPVRVEKDLTESSYAFGNLAKVKAPPNKRVRRDTDEAAAAGRRHSENSLTFVRSSEPGCQCPSPGIPKGNQELKINADCFNSVNDLLHLFVHVLGLDHQHNMYDRDSYLHILWDKLTPEIKKEMQKKLPPAASMGFPYDYQSVMHYPWLQIKNGVTNIMYPIWNDGWGMGHWQGLSSTDVHKLNLIYFKECSVRKRHAQE
ncbi:uncharacterized protein [Epargyreus clarus]|uniref:uncharacterized protein n=1 Tax=Epargyreus clarus TaxID=520877 RepID=UPI003C30410D